MVVSRFLRGNTIVRLNVVVLPVADIGGDESFVFSASPTLSSISPGTCGAEAFDMKSSQSSERVSRFLGRLETRRRKAKRARIIALGVGAAVAGVAYLTSIGIAPTEVRDLVASASALVVGVALTKS